MDLKLPEQIDRILARLRMAIRRYVLVRGLAVLLTVVVLLFWITLGIDTTWFGLTRLEIPRGVRLLISLICLTVLIVVAYQALIWQLLIQLRRRALALLLERRFPELDDRLITVVEMSENGEHEKTPASSVTHRMVQKTIDDANRLVKGLDTSQVFDFRPLKLAVVLATVAVASLVATAAASPSTMSHWSKAYLKLSRDYWDRKNGLEIVAMTQPGDRIRNFENGQLKHAAGTDLTIIARVREGKTAPEQVTISYQTESDTRGRAVMSPAGDGQFRHTIGNLVDDLKFTITGGDFTTVVPFSVHTVPEPALTNLVATCDYPEYTDWNRPQTGEPRERPIEAAELSLPMETSFVLRAESTNPLHSVRVIGRHFELVIRKDEESGRPRAVCRFEDERGVILQRVEITPEKSGPFISESGRQLAIPMLITQREDIIKQNFEKTDQLRQAPHLVIDREDFPRFMLEDENRIVNLEPIDLRLIGIADEPPQITSRLIGIGNAITRKANIPLEADLTDDYGLASIAFQYRLQEDEAPRRKPTSRQPGGAESFVMNDNESTPLEKFDVLPLDYEVGDILYLNLVAEDEDNLNGPHLGAGETYRLKVVTEEELLSILHQDELNLRSRYEQMLDELTRSRDGFASSLRENPDESEEEAVLVDSTQRTLNVLRKDFVEADSIRTAFEDIQREMINNRIDSPQVRARLQGRIITPLARILREEYTTTEDHFLQLDSALRSGESPPISPRICLRDFDTLLTELRRILEQMRELENFREVIEMLKTIIEEEEALKAETEKERKKKLMDLLN